MKEIWITVLRNRETSSEAFRQASHELATTLASESDVCISKESQSVETPLGQARGIRFQHEVILVPILRSGLTLLHPFMQFYPKARIGFIGTKRNETTAVPELYYINLPDFNHHNPIFLLDPMIATGGSSVLAVKLLKEAGAIEKQITLFAFIGAPEGIAHFKKECPEAGLIIAQIDKGLDEQKRIVPGLGDFGDRYFGTTGEAFHA